MLNETFHQAFSLERLPCISMSNISDSLYRRNINDSEREKIQQTHKMNGWKKYKKKKKCLSFVAQRDSSHTEKVGLFQQKMAIFCSAAIEGMVCLARCWVINDGGFSFFVFISSSFFPSTFYSIFALHNSHANAFIWQKKQQPLLWSYVMRFKMYELLIGPIIPHNRIKTSPTTGNSINFCTNAFLGH